MTTRRKTHTESADERMHRYVHNDDESAVPDALDDLPRAIARAVDLGRRYMEYAELARRVLEEVQRQQYLEDVQR